MFVYLCVRIEKKLVCEVDDIDNLNDGDFPSLINNIPKFSILSVSKFFNYNFKTIIFNFN